MKKSTLNASIIKENNENETIINNKKFEIIMIEMEKFHNNLKKFFINFIKYEYNRNNERNSLYKEIDFLENHEKIINDLISLIKRAEFEIGFKLSNDDKSELIEIEVILKRFQKLIIERKSIILNKDYLL